MNGARWTSATSRLSRGPLTAGAVARRLWCEEGFSWLHGPGLLGHRARRSFEVWRAAEQRAVLPLTTLRHVEATTSARWRVTYAFWTDVPPTSWDLQRLITRADSFDESSLRRESLPYTELSPWRGPQRAFDDFTPERDKVALALSDPVRGRYVFTQEGRRSAPEVGMPSERFLVVWARLGGVDHIFPVPSDLQC